MNNIFTSETFMIIREYVQLGIIILVSVGIHEFAHAYVSYKLGDPTPKIQKRLTPNPFKHIDPIGFLAIFFIRFGRGKPVQIDPSYYKNPNRDEFLTAMAGPISNILLGTIGIFIFFLYAKITNIQISNLQLNNFDLVSQFWFLFSLINFGLATFNMIPLPPLDGYRIVKIISHKAGTFLEKNTIYIFIGFLVLFIFGPFQETLGTFITTVSFGLFRIISLPFSLIFY